MSPWRQRIYPKVEPPTQPLVCALLPQKGKIIIPGLAQLTTNSFLDIMLFMKTYSTFSAIPRSFHPPPFLLHKCPLLLLLLHVCLRPLFVATLFSSYQLPTYIVLAWLMSRYITTLALAPTSLLSPLADTRRRGFVLSIFIYALPSSLYMHWDGREQGGQDPEVVEGKTWRNPPLRTPNKEHACASEPPRPPVPTTPGPQEGRRVKSTGDEHQKEQS